MKRIPDYSPLSEGTQSAYTVDRGNTLRSLKANGEYRFVAHITCKTGATINYDSTGVYDLRTIGGRAIRAGQIRDGQVVRLRWNSDGYFEVLNPVLMRNALDFGAYGDGVSDDFHALQSMMNLIRIVNITRSGTTATVTTVNKHNFAVGQEFTLEGADSAEYNGTHTVTAVLGSLSFTYEVSGSPATPDNAVNSIVYEPYTYVDAYIPPGEYSISNALQWNSRTRFRNAGKIIFNGGSTRGHIFYCRADGNMIIDAGHVDANEQTNDNIFGFSGTTNFGDNVSKVIINNLIAENTRHSGTVPDDVLSGGGKIITIDFGVVDFILNNCIANDCDLGLFIGGKNADGGRARKVIINNATISNSTYMGLAIIGSVAGSPAESEDLQVTLNNVTLENCAEGQHANFGCIVADQAYGVSAHGIVIISTGDDGIMPVRGSFRRGMMEIDSIVAKKIHGVWNTDANGGSISNDFASIGFDMIVHNLEFREIEAGAHMIASSSASYNARDGLFMCNFSYYDSDWNNNAWPGGAFVEQPDAGMRYIICNKTNGDHAVFDNGTLSSSTSTIPSGHTHNYHKRVYDSVNNLCKLQPANSGDFMAVANHLGQTLLRVTSGNDIDVTNYMIAGNLALESATAATTLGSVTHKIPLYDNAKNLVCYLPGYDNIT